MMAKISSIVRAGWRSVVSWCRRFTNRKKKMSTNRLLQNPGFHLVVFVDLLGQTNELEKFIRPRTLEEQRAGMEATVRTARQIDLVRTSLTGLIQEVASRPPSEAILAQLPNNEAGESFKRFRK